MPCLLSWSIETGCMKSLEKSPNAWYLSFLRFYVLLTVVVGMLWPLQKYFCVQKQTNKKRILNNLISKKKKLLPWVNLVVEDSLLTAVTFFFLWSWTNNFAYRTITCNSLNPKSDQHLISPLIIIPESKIKVTRIREMITS